MPVNIQSYPIQSLIDPTTWTPSEGSATGFSVNGAANENIRFIDEDPFGLPALIWEARPEAASGADGGWNGSLFSIDNTKLYRFSVWVNRTAQGNGNFYLGLRGYNSSSSNVGVYKRNDGNNSTNPYFWSTGTPTTVGEWTLVVGHVWPVGSGTGANHADSGRYTIDGGRVGGISIDFVWRSDNTQSLLRTYLYYSTDISTRQRWVYPRVDLVDGTEPSIDELLANPPATVEISNADVRELHYDSPIQDGLVLHLDAGLFNTVTGTTWYDLSGNGNHGTLTNGPTFNSSNGGGIVFDGTNDYVDLESDVVFKSSGGWTVESWVYYNFVPDAYNNSNSPGNFIGSETITHNSWYWCVLGKKLALWNRSPGVWKYGSTIIQPNTWYNAVLVSYDSGTSYQMYLNAIPEDGDHKTYSWNSTYSGLNVRYVARGNSSHTRYLTGNLPITRIYNRALSSAEIEYNYSVSKDRFGTDNLPYEPLTFNLDTGISSFRNGSSMVTLYKDGGTANSWTEGAYSNESFTAPCTLEFFKNAESSDNGQSYAMIGWNVDPTTNSSYNSIDIAAYPYRTSTFRKYTNGSSLGDSGAWDSNKKIYMSYDTDGYVRFYNGSTLLYTYNYGTGKTVYVDSSFYHSNTTYSKFENIRVIRKSWNGSGYV